MKRLMIAGVVAAVALFDSSFVCAKTFYLKNGEEIEYQSYRKQGDTVFLLINRDTQVEFAAGEVDFKKTGRNKTVARAKKHRKPVVVAAARAKAEAKVAKAEARETKINAKVAKVEAKVAEPKKAESVGKPRFAIAMPENCEPCAPPLEKQLAEAYAKYNRAAESGDFRQIEQHMTELQAKGSREALAKVTDKGELEKRRQVLKGLASKDYKSQACLVTPDGTNAALAGTGQAHVRWEVLGLGRNGEVREGEGCLEGSDEYVESKDVS